MLDHLGHMIGASGNQSLMYRHGIDYNKTRDSQDEKNSMWHSMMSNEEAENGMSEKQAMLRGLKFGWDNIFDQENGEDLGKLGQGLHALQDAMAHKGAKTNDHLFGKTLSNNLNSTKMMWNDMYGSTNLAGKITKSALIVSNLLKGEKSSLKDGDTLTLTGMSSSQFDKVMKLLLKQGFRGKLKTEE